MRYVDFPTTHADIELPGSATRVWAFVTDIEVPVRFSPELKRVQWLDGASGPVLGARFAGWNRHPVLGEWQTLCQVTSIVPLRRFEWSVTDADGRFDSSDATDGIPLATWWYDIAVHDGGVGLRLSVRVGPARSGISLAIDRWPDREEMIIASRLAELHNGIRATLTGISTLMSSGD